MTNVFGEADSQAPASTDKRLTPQEQMAKIKEEVVERLYKNDPFIREGIDAQRAAEASRGKPQPKESPFLYDEEGNYLGVKPEYKGKVSPYDQMKEIRRNMKRRFGGE